MKILNPLARMVRFGPLAASRIEPARRVDPRSRKRKQGRLVAPGHLGAFALTLIVVAANGLAEDRSQSFVTIPSTVSKEAAAFLKTYDDPAARAPWPAGDDIAGW